MHMVLTLNDIIQLGNEKQSGELFDVLKDIMEQI